MIPQLIYLALLFIGLGMTITEHGNDKKGKHNAWDSIIAQLIIVVVLYYGGFFNPLFK